MNFIIIMLLSTLTLSSCSSEIKDEKQNVQQEKLSKEYDFDNEEVSFLDIDGVFQVTITQGDRNYVKVTATPKIQDQINVKVNNSKLSIDLTGEITSKNNLNIPVDIVVKDIEKINFTGFGKLKFNNIKTDSLYMETEFVGKIHLGGTVNYLDFKNEGVGMVNARELIAKSAKVINNGIGKMSVYASEDLDITVDGIGKVNYYGEPKKKNIKKSGIGKVSDQGMR